MLKGRILLILRELVVAIAMQDVMLNDAERFAFSNLPHHRQPTCIVPKSCLERGDWVLCALVLLNRFQLLRIADDAAQLAEVAS